MQSSEEQQGEIKTLFLCYQCKEKEESNRMGKIINLFKKIREPREHFMQRWAQ